MFTAERIVEERAREGGPVRVAMVGAGPLARVIALQLATDLPEVRLVAIAHENLDAARGVCAAAGIPAPRVIESHFGLCSAIAAGECAVTQDWRLICEAGEIDAIIEAADIPAHGADIVRLASSTGKHVIPTSAESAEGAQEILNHPADRIELVRVEVDATNFFDIVRSGDDGKPVGPGTDDPQRPAAQA